jgi:ABC-type nitrate/sulfonate/bicarbonate transport system substrate-binding protein
MRVRFNNYPWVDKLYENQTILTERGIWGNLSPAMIKTKKIYQQKTHLLTTFLKAFHGAHIWTTYEELELFAECFEQMGMQIK